MNDAGSALPLRFEKLPVRELDGGLRLIEAVTMRSRQRGLGGLAALPPGLGLEIAVASIHTFTMRFALDLIWLSGDRRILRVDHDVPRWRVRVCRRAQSVIETVAGQADAFSDLLSRS